MTDGQSVVRAGTGVTIVSAKVVFLDEEEFETDDPRRLSERLMRAYAHPSAQEPLHNPALVRAGFHSLSLAILFDGDGALHHLRVEWPESRYLDGLLDVTVKGNRTPVWSWNRPTSLTVLQRANGRILATFFSNLGAGEGQIWVKEYSTSPGLHAYSDYAVFCVTPDAGVIGRGTITLVRDHTRGDTYCTLAELDGALDPCGRPDQPGNYTRGMISHGP